MGALVNEADTLDPNDAPSYQMHYEFVLLRCSCLSSSKLGPKIASEAISEHKIIGGITSPDSPSCCVVKVMCPPTHSAAACVHSAALVRID